MLKEWEIVAKGGRIGTSTATSYSGDYFSDRRMKE